MELSFEATYEEGVLKPVKPLPLAEHEKVQVTVHPCVRETAGPDEAEQIVRRSYGLIGWSGDVETLRRLAIDAEFDVQESG